MSGETVCVVSREWSHVLTVARYKSANFTRAPFFYPQYLTFDVNDANIADIVIKREIEAFEYAFDSRMLVYFEENLRIFEKEREYKRLLLSSNVKTLSGPVTL